MSDTPDDGQEPPEAPDPDETPRPRVPQTTAIQRADDGTKSVEFSDDPDEGTVEVIVQRRPETPPPTEGSSSQD